MRIQRSQPKQPKPLRAETMPPHEPRRRERQVVRILAILRVLAQGRTPTVQDLAAEFRTRRETIYRDLRVLQDSGYPITGDETGRLSRPRLVASRVPDIRFSPAELNALLLAVTQAHAALPTAESLASAAFKLKALAISEPDAIPPALDERFETWTCGSKDYRAHEGRIAILIEAILRKRRCRVEYRAPSRPASKVYEFDPYRLLFVGGGLYVVGRVPKYTGTATLAVDRLLSLVLSEIEFEVDAAFDPRESAE